MGIKVKTPISIVNSPLGIGKTTIVGDIINEDQLRAIILTPTHDLAKEIEGKFGTDAVHVYGRDAMVKAGRLDCPHHVEMKAWESNGRSGSHTFCHADQGRCQVRHECPYLAQHSKAVAARIALLTHDQIMTLSERRWIELAEDRDVMVVDENILQKYRREHIITIRQLRALEHALRSFKDSGGILYTWVLPLLKLINSDLSGTLILPDDCQPYSKLLSRVDQFFQEHSPNVMNVMRILAKAAHQKAPLKFHPVLQDGRCNQSNVLTVILHGYLPRHLPIFVLDSTSRPEYYAWALGGDFEVQGINPQEGRRLKKNARIIQCVSGGYANATLIETVDGQPRLSRSGRLMFEFIDSHINPDSRHGTIATLKFKKLLEREGMTDRLRHYNILRGVNEFNNVDTLFIVGYQMHSYLDIARSARIMFGQDWDDENEAERLRDQKEFQGIQYWQDHMRCRVLSLRPQNPFINAYYRMFIVGEIEQALGRARMFLPAQKGQQRTIYLLTNIPTSVDIDEIMELSQTEQPKQLTRMIAAAERLLSRTQQFERKDLISESGLNKNIISQYMPDVCNIMKLKEVTLEHNKKAYQRGG